MNDLDKSKEELIRELQELKKENDSFKSLSTKSSDTHQSDEDNFSISGAIQEVIIDHMIDFVWSVDAIHFGLTYFNHSFSEFIYQTNNYKLKLGDRPVDFFQSQEYINLWHRMYERTLNEGAYKTEYKVYDQTHTIALNFNLLKQDHNIIGISVIGTDITDLKHAEQALQASEIQFRTLYLNTAIGIYRTTPDGRIILANPSLVRMLGYNSFDELTKRNLEQEGFEPDYDRERFMEQIERDGKVEGLETAWTRFDGSSIHIRENASVIRDASGKPLFYDGTVENISERKQAEKALMESEEKFKHIISSMQTGLLLQGPHAEVLLNNSKALELLDLDEEMLFGKKAYHLDWNVIHEDGSPFPPDTFPVLQSIASRQSVRNIVMGVYRPTKADRVWLLADAEPHLNDNGTLKQVVCIFTNITDYKRDKDDLFINTSRLTLALEVAEMVWWNMDIVTGQITFDKNKADLLGYHPDKFNHYRDFTCLLHPEDYHNVMAAMRDHLNGISEKYEIEYRVKANNGEYIWVYDVGKIVKKDNANKPLQFTGLILNITKRKHTDEIIRKQNADLQKLNADKDHFLTILAHDLKSPFNSILGFLDLLTYNLHKYDINKIERQIHVISTSAHKIYKLLEDILLWVGANSGKIPFEPKKLNFVNICNDVIDNLKLSASNKNIFINQILEEQIYVFGDRDMIHTILRNLVSNAIKFTLPNGKIDIYGELDHSYVIITVSDNGTGMEPEVLTKLFDITQKITTEGTAHEKGTGLGLLICKEFVEQHNGQIWVESQLGKGTNFKFSIPLSKN